MLLYVLQERVIVRFILRAGENVKVGLVIVGEGVERGCLHTSIALTYLSRHASRSRRKRDAYKPACLCSPEYAL